MVASSGTEQDRRGHVEMAGEWRITIWGNGPQTPDIGVQACDLHRSFPDGENQEGVFSRGNSMYKGVMKCLARLVIYLIVIVCLID